MRDATRSRGQIIDPLADYDESHKASLEHRAEQVTRVLAVSRKLFEILSESGLGAADRDAAVKFFNVLQNTFGQR